jgi:two-component system, cell cycle sensor histidine kinase and response regulator CckA
MADHVGLIVDDEPSIRRFIRAILDGESLQILEAGNAAEALRIVQKLGGRLDLIVSDIKMPGDMDGVDLAYSIRHSYPAVPVVLISGWADEETVKNADADFVFIQKPFVTETILSACRRAMAAKVPAQSETPLKERVMAG